MIVSAISFLDEGVAETLDALKTLGGVNTVFFKTFGYAVGLGGRQMGSYSPGSTPKCGSPVLKPRATR